MLITFVLHLFTIVVGVAAQHPIRPRAPGVAFRLTPDYGIASIYLKDGTSVPVAQVQGSPEYQAFMRKPRAPAPKEDTTLCQLLAPGLHLLTPLFGSVTSVCRNSNIGSTLGVMQNLKTAVEAYLGTNICFAALSLDVVEDHKIDVAQEALQALGLRQVLPTAQAAKSVVLAHRPDTTPKFDEEPWVVLAIDYSTHWYNVGLLTMGEAGIVDPVPDFTSGPKIDEEYQLDAIEHSLSHILANPPSGVYLPERIHQLVVYGDDAKNESLRNLLTKMLNTDLVRDARVSSSIFDGTNFTAHAAHVHMDTVDFEMNVKPAWGCQWRSSFYSDTQNEL
ncbi:hypothetical protein BKA66DRAFT_560326 [Pyrenochaeta sp. MPI-SDFR-AT-0127]|nr:hypothetical protein BKA66DRAFT_560326 [Pyrenochaeta sp. MPI-SDFR-AT-0127]